MACVPNVADYLVAPMHPSDLLDVMVKTMSHDDAIESCQIGIERGVIALDKEGYVIFCPQYDTANTITSHVTDLP